VLQRGEVLGQLVVVVSNWLSAHVLSAALSETLEKNSVSY
jgi:hypothetical protein